MVGLRAVVSQPSDSRSSRGLFCLCSSGLARCPQVETHSWEFSSNSRNDLTVSESQRGTIIVE